MRNLKRVLSLALAMVMVLGMMVITTSAATFTDAEEITYTEAVDVVSAIGVINGFEAADGTFTFNPTETLTREQGAKMLCYLLLGKTTADKLTGSGNFSDVKSTRWSAGSIDYCASLGILAGMGDGTFNPEGKLTAVQYGKMLLCALGYDAKIEGYEGSNWATNIALDMLAAGLTHDDIVLDQPLTREQAAQMTFQALTATMVDYDDKGSSITVGGVEIVTGASKAEIEPAIAGRDYSLGLTTGDEATLELCEYYYKNLTMAAGTGDDFGRPASHMWFVNKDNVVGYSRQYDALVCNVMIPASTTVDVTGAKNNTLAKIAEANELDVNYAESYAKGDTVELYINYLGEIYDTVVLHTELAQIVKVAKTTDADAKYTYDVTVKTDAGNLFYTDKTLVGFDFDTMTKDTYVTLVKGTNTAIVALADSVTGKQTAKGTGYVKVDGEKLNYADDVWTIDAVDYTNSFNFYVDAKGYVIGTEKVAAAKVATNLLYVADGKFVKGDSWTSDVAKLAVINLDGTSEVLNMAITVKQGVKYVNKTDALTTGMTYTPGFYAYTLTDDGEIATLKAVSAGVKNTAELLNDGQTVTIRKGKANVTVAGSTFYATNDTELVVIDPTNATATTITGYSNFVANYYEVDTNGLQNTQYENTLVDAILYTYDGDELEAVYVLGATISVTEAGVKGWFVEKGDEYEISGYTFQNVVYCVDGENVTYATLKANSYIEYAYIEVIDGVAYMEAPYYTTYNAAVKKVTDSYIIAGNQILYYSNKGVAYNDVTNVAKNGVVEDDAVVVGDIITYTYSESSGTKYVTNIYTTYAAQEDGVLAKKNAAYLQQVLGFSAADAAAAADPANSDWVVVQFTRPANSNTTVFSIYDATTGALVKTYTSTETTAGVRGVMADPNGTAGSYTYTIKIDNQVIQSGAFEVE